MKCSKHKIELDRGPFGNLICPECAKPKKEEPVVPPPGIDEQNEIKSIIDDFAADLEKRINQYYPKKKNRTWKVKFIEENSEEYKASKLPPTPSDDFKE